MHALNEPYRGLAGRSQPTRTLESPKRVRTSHLGFSRMEENGALLNRERLAKAHLLIRSLGGRREPEPLEQSQLRRRAGSVQAAVIDVLAGASCPLRAREIHAAAQILANEPLSWNTVRACLHKNARRPDSPIERTGPPPLPTSLNGPRCLPSRTVCTRTRADTAARSNGWATAGIDIADVPRISRLASTRMSGVGSRSEGLLTHAIGSDQRFRRVRYGSTLVGGGGQTGALTTPGRAFS